MILIIDIIAFNIFDSKKGESNFSKELIDIDTSAVTEILIYPKSKDPEEIKLFKKGENWNIILQNNKTVKADEERIREMFTQLLIVKPKRLAANDESKWKDFEVVDTFATRIKIIEGDETTLDLIIGRFSFSQQLRTMTTFVRLMNEKEVYAIDGFLGAAFNQKPDSFRDKKLINSDYKTWNRLSFQSTDETFQLTKSGDNWMIDGQRVDSLKTVNYLSSIQNLFGRQFMDDFEQGNRQPDNKLVIETNEGKQISIKTFMIDSTTNYITSSINASCFDANKGGIFKKVFPGKITFQKEQLELQ